MVTKENKFDVVCCVGNGKLDSLQACIKSLNYFLNKPKIYIICSKSNAKIIKVFV